MGQQGAKPPSSRCHERASRPGRATHLALRVVGQGGIVKGIGHRSRQGRSNPPCPVEPTNLRNQMLTALLTILAQPQRTALFRPRLLSLVVFPWVVSACYEVKVDTLERWCENSSGTDLTGKYAPAWILLPSVSFDHSAVRADYTRIMDSLALDQVQGRSDRMAWLEGTTLHLESPSDLMMIAPESVLAGWKSGLDRAREGRSSDDADECVFSTAASLFDTVTIHFGVQDIAGQFVGDTTVKLPTGRIAR
jgi:hypothetical protein